MIVADYLVLFSALSFLFFGISCFFTEHMRNEFIRYGLSNKLKLIGTLQIAGATGLIVGYYTYSNLALISAIALSILMLLGFGVRLKIKDPFLKSLPSIFYAILNIIIAVLIYQNF